MWWNGDWTWMGHHWWWGWFMPFGGFWFLIILIALFVALLLRSPHRHMPPPRPAALDLLEQRYAKGEIGREEYLEKRRDLMGEK